MVESSTLLKCRRSNPTEGSNPSLSATPKPQGVAKEVGQNSAGWQPKPATVFQTDPDKFTRLGQTDVNRSAPGLSLICWTGDLLGFSGFFRAGRRWKEINVLNFVAADDERAHDPKVLRAPHKGLDDCDGIGETPSEPPGVFNFEGLDLQRTDWFFPAHGIAFGRNVRGNPHLKRY